jgi:hypothetical protein
LRQIKEQTTFKATQTLYLRVAFMLIEHAEQVSM